MNGQVLNAPQQKNGVLPCLDAPAERGIYFFNEGGYITIGKMCRDYSIWNYVLDVCVCTRKDFFIYFLCGFPIISSCDYSSTHCFVLHR